jgi:type II restriction/modification system DNA methylase subunit YeeA
MTPAEFITKWSKVELTERSAAQQHFLDLCEMLGHAKPAEADPAGESFTFERGASKHGGGEGWADVWKRGFFGWEYKGKHKDLAAAYDQLLQYREALENPPLLVVCDLDRIIVHTNFTATAKRVFTIPLAELGEPRHLDTLRAVFFDPEKLKPGVTSQAITAQAARQIAEIAWALRQRGEPPHEVARFLDRIVFCLFAEDIGLLPEKLFQRILANSKAEPPRFAKLIGQLFDAMADGGDFGAERIRHFNGNLFTAGPVLALTADEIEQIARAGQLDWSAVDPSIFGTLFERGMDPAKRSQLGAHYTSREDIETLVEPVVMQPLRREWSEGRAKIDTLLAKAAAGKPAAKKARGEAAMIVHRFLTRLANVRVLDPACGSGNFLYVTLQKLKDLEKEVLVFAMENGLGAFLPQVGPWQLYGIELNEYAFDLAQMTVWIGYLQWTRANGFGITQTPVLRKMDNFQCKDAILDLSDPANPREPEWPRVDFIVGNPPFLGGGFLRKELGDDYVTRLFATYGDRLPNFSDLCCYWFEKARAQIVAGKCRRAGLLATQGIRGGANREVLKRIKESGDIFFAVSDREWILEGANVHVSLVGFDDGEEKVRTLDGSPAATINANLTSTADITQARPLKANLGVCFMGPSPKAPFDISEETARAMLQAGGNVHGRPNSDVIRRVQSGVDLTRGDRGVWTIDFGLMGLDDAAKYEAPFEYVVREIKPIRVGRKSQTNKSWWQYERPRVDLRQALKELHRSIATPEVAKHRIFAWRGPECLCNQQTLIFTREDDYFFGILHSRAHEVWALAAGTQLREKESGFRYTPTTCFETFPFPEPTPEQQTAIAAAARELDELRTRWLNPPEWTREEVLVFPGSTSGPWARFVHDPDARGIGTVRYPRLVPKDADAAAKLAARTLTRLYNERPAWLDLAHRKLDEAVFAAYGWEPSLSDDEILARLLALNLQAGAPANEPSAA